VAFVVSGHGVRRLRSHLWFMANISNNAYRSRLAQTASNRQGASGFHHNPQAFDHLVGTRLASGPAYVRKNWNYMTPGRVAFAKRLGLGFDSINNAPKPRVVTKVVTTNGEQEFEAKSGQFALAV
jgi:hypothetical protein